MGPLLASAILKTPPLVQSPPGNMLAWLDATVSDWGSPSSSHGLVCLSRNLARSPERLLSVE